MDTQAKKEPVRLNLGCGNKLYREFINVDVVAPVGEMPAGVKFVEDDIRALNKFEPNSVNEMIAMHLIEHIPIYELEPTLIRWHEVLSPGGHVIVEMPCIVKSCINFLQMITTKDSNIYYNLGLKGIYGEPHPENPWMEHKWGWTFETLAQQFRNAGFVLVREEVAQTHMKALRDFRLVAFKQAPVVKEDTDATTKTA